MPDENYTEDQLFAMSDEELEEAFTAAKASADTPTEDDVEVDEDVDNEDTVTSDQSNDTTDDVPEDTNNESEENDGESEEKDDESAGNTEEDATDVEPEAADSPKEDAIHTFNVDGKDYEMTSQELVDKFPDVFSKAMTHDKITKAVKPWRKTIDALETASIGHDDVNLMIDVLKGDKGAIAEVAKRNGIDLSDIDTDPEKAFKPNEYGRDEAVIAVKDTLDSISSDPEYATTETVLKQWDSASWDALSGTPEDIKLLHEDVKSGMYHKLQPIAEKLRVFDKGSKSDLEYYGEAFTEYAGRVAAREAAAQRAEAAKEAAAKAEEARIAAEARQKEAATKRKAAASTKKAAPTNKAVIDDSDEAFDEWLKRLDL